MSGLRFKSSFATLGKVAIQPKASVPILKTLGKKTLAENLFTAVAATSKSKFLFGAFDFRLIQTSWQFRPVDTRYTDELPRSATKFTPFEEISGIASTRPEILSVSEFKPIFTNNGFGFTAAGEFLDAQVKLMNLRHEAMATLIKDLKSDPDLAEQLDQIEGDFLKHVQNLKERVDFLATLQTYVEKIVSMLDLRDAKSNVDAASVLAYYFGASFSNLNTAQATLPSCTYADLLSQHGFNKNNVSGFSSTKVFLQTLYEAKKVLRAGSDELVGTDPSLAARDSDPVTLNKRTYHDPHVALEHVNVPTYDDIRARNVHESDTRLTSLLRELETYYRSIDKVFVGSTSEEVTYTLKLKTLAREIAYSNAISNSSTSALLGDYSYPIRTDVGNQQLFDAVFGQLGTRITDNRVGTNANAVASVVSRVDGDKAVLTYEVDYLEDEQGSVFTPGASYYVTSAVRPNNANAFSHERAAELVTRMSGVVDRYANFVSRFNLLPRVGNVVINQLANASFVLEPITMANTLYQLYVDNSTGYLKSDVAGNPIVDFLCEAATNAGLRANLLMYVSTVTNASSDGLANAEEARALAGQDLRAEAQKRASDAENQNARVGPTVDKLIKNCIALYKQSTGDTSGASKVEHALRNFNEQGPLSRLLAYVKASYDVYKTVVSSGYSRYSHLSDVYLVALSLQTTLDTARRYAYNPTRVNKATYINSNYKLTAVASLARGSVQQLTKQAVTKTFGKSKLAVSALSTPVRAASLTVSHFVSKLSLKQAVVARLEREELLMLRTVLAPLHAMRLVRDNMREFVLYLQKQENLKVINDVLNVVGDRKLVELLADKGQVRVLYDTVDTVLQKISLQANNKANTDLTDVVSLTRGGTPDDDLKVFDDSFITSKTANVLKAAFANAKFSPDRGSNIRVIAFGLPHGFSTHLENKFKVSTFAEQARTKRKQNDVVVADVYKVDVRYPDLVFKPIPKVLELSRFAVRDEREFSSVEVGAPLDKVLDAIPTKDYSNFSHVTITKGGNAVSALATNVDQGEYGFMTTQDAQAMHRNTIMSYLLELYFRLLTGIPLSERELYVVDPDENDRPAPFVVQSILKQATKKIFKVEARPDYFLNYSLISAKKAVPYSIATKTSKTFGKFKSVAASKLSIMVDFNHKARAHVQSTAVVANHAAKKKTVYTDREVAAKYMMLPKLFERVFFVDVDPDDFEIDREETFKSEVGKSTFSQLQQAGEIETKSETLSKMTRDSYYLKDHKLEKQMTFEKYFVVVRAYTPLTTRTR